MLHPEYPLVIFAYHHEAPAFQTEFFRELTPDRGLGAFAGINAATGQSPAAGIAMAHQKHLALPVQNQGDGASGQRRRSRLGPEKQGFRQGPRES